MPNPTLLFAIGEEDRSVRQATWTLTTADPTGTAVSWPEYGDCTWAVAATGTTFGAATLELQGSNTNVDADFIALSNAAGAAALSYTTAPKCASSIEAPRYLRCKLTVVGSGATVIVNLIGRRGSSIRQ